MEMTLTYIERVFQAEAGRCNIRFWLGGSADRDAINRVARFMTEVMHIADLNTCRDLVRAVAESDRTNQ